MVCRILSTGMYVPGEPIPNSALIEGMNTNNEWIVKNTGIKQRYISDLGETASYLGRKAAEQALKGIDKNRIGMLIVATTSPDKISPSTACIIKADLGLTNAVAFDISAVCSGFLYSLAVADKFINDYDLIMIIGVDTFSNITDWKRRDCIYFGDGAGAIILKRSDKGFSHFTIKSDSYDIDGFTCEHGKNFQMDTRKVYTMATRLIPLAIEETLKKAGLSVNDISYIVPHQPSVRILDEVADKLIIDRKKVLKNMNKYGNTVAATIPIVLHEVLPSIKQGEKIIIAAVGSGWTYGAVIYEV